MSDVKKIRLSKFTTESGTNTDIDIHFQHFGQDYNNSPVVLVIHSLTGNSNVTGKSGWWSEIIGQGKVIDTNFFAVLAFNIPGNGYNNYFLDNYVEFHTGDIAKLFYLGLKKMKIDRLYAIIGGSIGGGITWEMGCLYNNLADNLIPVACDWKSSDWIIANTFLQKRLLENSNNPIQDARIHAMLTYRTPFSICDKFSKKKNINGKYAVEDWLLYHGDNLSKRFSLEAYKAMNYFLSTVNVIRDGQSPEEKLSKINSNIHIIAVNTDQYFISDRDRETYKLLKPKKANVFYYEIDSIHGHDAFLIENKKMIKILRRIFKSKRNESSIRENKYRLPV